MEDIDFKSLKGAVPTKYHRLRKERQIKKQLELKQKLICLQRYRFQQGLKSCCRQKCTIRLDLNAVEKDRERYVKILDESEKTLWLKRHYRDDSSITGFLFR